MAGTVGFGIVSLQDRRYAASVISLIVEQADKDVNDEIDISDAECYVCGLLMPKEKTMATQRTILSMTPELKERIKRFRFDKQINTEAEAIRYLIERGLKAEGVK